MSADISNVAAREHIRIVRGRVLEILHQYYHTSCPKATVVQITKLVGDYNKSEIISALQYLKSKDYIADVTQQVDYGDERTGETWEITASGIDLVEKSIKQDNGITIG